MSRLEDGVWTMSVQSKLRAAALAVSLLALAGCGAHPTPVDNTPKSSGISGSDYSEVTVKLSDGRSVLCLRDHAGYGATSCDWGHAK